jgi:hypothetical protein
VGESWWSEACRSITASEYRPSLSRAGLQAPNRAQGLRTFFRDCGVEIVPRGEDAAGWAWGWQTTGLGRGDAGQTVRAVAPVCEGTRVEYRQDAYVEWYENRPEGVEQGFTLLSPPPGTGPILVEGTLSGGLTPHIDPDDAWITFRDAGGVQVLQYGELRAVDAGGRSLPSLLTCAGSGICLTVDDSGADYPIVIDPIVNAPQWHHAADYDYANFGFSVCTAGDVNGDGYSDIVVGCPGWSAGEFREGAVFAFYGSSTGLSATTSWIADGDQEQAHFGEAVSTAGDVNGDGYDDIVAGGPWYDNGEFQEGYARVYLGSATGLQSTPVWSGEGNQEICDYGSQVGTAGDVNGDGYDEIIVAAPHYTNGHSREGRVYVYYGTATGVHAAADWVGESNVPNAAYGTAVGTAGDVNGDGYADVVIGAPYFTNGQTAEGRAYLYLGSAAGLSTTAGWTAEPNVQYTHFGMAANTAGDVNGDGYADVIVGADQYSVGVETNEGAAWVYYGSSAGPGSDADWLVHGDQVDGHFGYAAATAGDVNGDGYSDVIVGAPMYDNGQTDEGRVYVYYGYFSGLSTESSWIKESDRDAAEFGFAVATAGDVNGDGYSDLIVGSPFYSSGEDSEGYAFVYHSLPDNVRNDPGWATESNQAEANYGRSVAGAGDLNGDGFSDVVVGASNYDNGEVDEGAVFVFPGTYAGISATPTWYAEANVAGAHLGVSVASAGDVNGDGYADIIVGAPFYTNSLSEEGAAFVWCGAAGSLPNGTPANAPWAAYGGQTGSGYGHSVASAGDVNADGFGDIIVGAYARDAGQTDEGGVYVYHGSATGPSPSWSWYNDSDQSYAEYGYSVASAGDFNGDGFGDVLIGSRRYDHPEDGEGAVFLYCGSNLGLHTGDADWMAESDQADARLGHAVASAGDVNGDGYSDVIAGAYLYDYSPGFPNSGGAFIWYGGTLPQPDGNPVNADWKVVQTEANAQFGTCVASAGDVNADGYSDILIGSPWEDFDLVDEGVAYLLLGSATGPGITTHWIGTGGQEFSLYGSTIASAGDVNGDGYSDVIVGAYTYDGGASNEGRALLYYGNDSRGLARNPQQMTTGFTAQIAPGGFSNSETAFGVKARARTPAGRDYVRMVWEVKPYGTDFNGAGLYHSSFFNTGVPSGASGSWAALTGQANGLEAATRYCWRVRFEAKCPFFPRSPWLFAKGNGATESDLWTAGRASDVTEDHPVSGALRIGIHPNPARGEATLAYDLPRAGTVRVSIHDLQGRCVRKVCAGVQEGGPHTLVWNGTDDRGRAQPAGVYWVRLESEGEKATRKLIWRR